MTEGQASRLLEDLGAAEFRARYLRNWPGVLRGYEFYRIARAIARARVTGV